MKKKNLLSESLSNVIYTKSFPFLAFCEKEKILLCITCILEDGHRHHEISSIANVLAMSFTSLFNPILPLRPLKSYRKSWVRPSKHARFWRRKYIPILKTSERPLLCCQRVGTAPGLTFRDFSMRYEECSMKGNHI